MKSILKYSSKLLLAGMFCLSIITSCDLEYENRNDINAGLVWNDRTMIISYLNDIHGGMMPGWPTGGDNCDESLNDSGSMSDYARGVIDAEKDGQKFEYEYIDKINFMLMKLRDIPESILTETENKQIAGQALFWRAWNYWGKVKTFGGVPLITQWQDINDKSSLFVPRNTTTECMEQIIKDLDTAIEYLPLTWDDENYGRIDKITAMAFKGRVLMNYASPLFNRNNDIARWETAYKANKDAIAALEEAGKGLYPDYAGIWKNEQNEEVIMVNQFFYPGHSTAGYMWYVGSFPIFSMVSAFPQKDGSPLKLDYDRFSSDPDYNADFLDRFYNNRDDRFYATIHCGGTRYPSKDDAPGGRLSGGQKYWSTWMLNESGTYTSMIISQLGENDAAGITGFRCIKGIDESKDKYNSGDGGSDWIEIRFTEVLMNMAECANEIGRTDEALDVIYQIRKRANIEAGTNNRYGVTASSQSEVREALINERFVEFAFEGKRGDDLRRWMRWDILNNMKHRQGLYIVLNDNRDLENFDWTWDIKNPEVRSKFHGVFIENLDKDEKYTFNYSENHWFYPINKEGLDRNSKLEQNNEWGGTFDPLK